LQKNIAYGVGTFLSLNESFGPIFQELKEKSTSLVGLSSTAKDMKTVVIFITFSNWVLVINSPILLMHPLNCPSIV